MRCRFCHITNERVEFENDLAFSIYDKYPVNEGHMLIISKRHFADFFAASEEEIAALFNLLKETRDYLEEKYQPAGYNVGVNVGEAAGQTVDHLHIHLIPRYEGDVDDPRGGVRKLKEELVPYYG